jgi:hypothetical protein
MNEHTREWPPDFDAFAAARRRQLDAMNADTVLREVVRATTTTTETPMSDRETVTIEGELTVLIGERRLVLGYFSPGQHDLADVVTSRLGFRDEAFGIGHVGPVRITIEALGITPRSNGQER